MTERAQADRGSAVAGMNFAISKLLVVSIVFAAAATSALIIQIVTGMPGPVPGPGPGGQPPPPPDLQPLAMFAVVTGFFVLAWLCVVVVFCRDQILLRLRSAPASDLEKLLATLRAELAADRERELQGLDERLAEYGERRETDGYLSGMRVATADPVEAKVRPLRPLPPQR